MAKKAKKTEFDHTSPVECPKCKGHGTYLTWQSVTENGVTTKEQVQNACDEPGCVNGEILGSGTDFPFGANAPPDDDDDMSRLPVFGKIPKARSKLKLQSEANRRATEQKTSASERTLSFSLDSGRHYSEVKTVDPQIDGIQAALNAAMKRGTSEQLTEQLTDSLRMTKLSESGELPISESTNPNEQKEDTMAAKKKTAKKPAKKSVKTAAPVGRERKLLLRLSNDEYEALQTKAAKQETSMANLLRSSALG